jgi:hypothetical protein
VKHDDDDDDDDSIECQKVVQNQVWNGDTSIYCFKVVILLVIFSYYLVILFI